MGMSGALELLLSGIPLIRFEKMPAFFLLQKGPFDIGNQATGVRNWSSLLGLAYSLQNFKELLDS